MSDQRQALVEGDWWPIGSFARVSLPLLSSATAYKQQINEALGGGGRPISDIHEVEHLAAKLTVATVLGKRDFSLPTPS